MTNLHTEEDAREKWCPHVRVADCGADNAVAANRSCAKEVNYNCIASECMAWQWVRTHINNHACPDGDLIPSTKTYGRCGLTSQGGKHG